MTDKKGQIKPFDGFSTLINVLMGTGPILLPPVVAASGIGLSAIVLSIIMVTSIMGAEFLIEILSITNCMNNHPLIKTNNNSSQLIEETSVISSQDANDLQSVKSPFEMKETIEYGTMGLILWGRKGQLINTLVVSVYLIGILISKGIIVGTIMSEVFNGIHVLDNYYCWLIFFYLISAALSFKDVSSIAMIQTIIALFRYLTIIMMFIGSIIIMSQEGVQPIKTFEFSEFSSLFGTSVLAFLMHHSTPQMMRPIQPQSAIKKVLLSAFFFGMFIFITVPLTGALAFADLSRYCYYNTVFDRSPIKFAYYIISFYMFLNISSLPIITITVRTNLMKMFIPHRLPKSSYQITKFSAIATLLILVPCVLCAMGIILIFTQIVLQNYIHLVVDFTGGVCGTILVFILPSLMVLKARRRSPYDYQQNPFKSSFKHRYWAYISIILGTAIIPYTLYLDINKLVNKSDPCLKSILMG